MAGRMQTVSDYGNNTQRENWHFVRKLILLCLLLAMTVLGILFLFKQNTTVPPVLVSFFTDACVGLVAGIACRIVLRRRNWPLLALTSAALATAALITLGQFTRGELGLGPWPYHVVTVNWLHAYNLLLQVSVPSIPSRIDPMEIAHFAIAIDLSWVGLRAWHRRPRVSARKPRLKARTQSFEEHRGSENSVIGSRQTAAVQLPQARPRPVVRGVGRFVRQRKVRTSAKALRPPVSHRGAANAGSGLQLAVHEDHRCPYCLEPVKRGDARGTVECPICHTLHHKDCWDITGTCQVPHLNT